MSKQFLRKRQVAERYSATTRWVERATNDGRLPQPEYPVGGSTPLWLLERLEENERIMIAGGGRLGWRNRLLAELATATAPHTAAILDQYRDQIDALPDAAREQLLAELQDVVAETPSTD